MTAATDGTVWLPVADAADILDIPPNRVHVWIRRYALRTQGAGRRRLVAIADVVDVEAATRPERLRRQGACPTR